jgi:site-specific DNA-cytosine methylase
MGVDSNKDSCLTYNRNVCPNARNSVICSDVRQLDFSKLPSIDAFMFGFPCNDFSVVGEQKGMNGVYGPLYSYGIQALNIFRPQWFLAENVGGLRSANDGLAVSDYPRGDAEGRVRNNSTSVSFRGIQRSAISAPDYHSGSAVRHQAEISSAVAASDSTPYCKGCYRTTAYTLGRTKQRKN